MTHDEDSRLGEMLESDLQDATDNELLRVLTAPQVSQRLLWRRPGPLAPDGEFLHRAFMAEAAVAGRTVSVTRKMWTALGDACVLPNGRVATTPALGGCVPLDFDSTDVLTIDLSGRRVRPKARLRGDERARALDRLTKAYEGIRETSGVVSGFVNAFVKVFVIQKDRDAPSLFVSGSDQLHIGRAVITNPHIQWVELPRVADAIVHEAIHSLLYMQVQSQPWGLQNYSGEYEPMVTSPWTGTRVLLSSYLHACFVWYGLIHFWALAIERNAFPTKGAAARLARATIGFLGEPLLADLDEATAAAVTPNIRSAIDSMQRSVQDTAKATGT
jgi:HEXXH motif-containing protein